MAAACCEAHGNPQQKWNLFEWSQIFDQGGEEVEEAEGGMAKGLRFLGRGFATVSGGKPDAVSDEVKVRSILVQFFLCRLDSPTKSQCLDKCATCQ